MRNIPGIFQFLFIYFGGTLPYGFEDLLFFRGHLTVAVPVEAFRHPRPEQRLLRVRKSPIKNLRLPFYREGNKPWTKNACRRRTRTVTPVIPLCPETGGTLDWTVMSKRPLHFRNGGIFAQGCEPAVFNDISEHRFSPQTITRCTDESGMCWKWHIACVGRDTSWVLIF